MALSFINKGSIKIGFVRKKGERMTNRQDRLHELCVQVRREDDLKRLDNGLAEINDILDSIVYEVDRTIRSLNRRVAKKYFAAAA